MYSSLFPSSWFSLIAIHCCISLQMNIMMVYLSILFVTVLDYFLSSSKSPIPSPSLPMMFQSVYSLYS